MGEVYQATDTRLGRDVALKFLSPGTALDEEVLERFQREARAVSALNHPNICTLHDIGDLEGAPYLVMELLEGESLKDRLASGPLPSGEALEVATQITEALEAAHASGIVHRDIKPANVFITGPASGRPGQAKLLDFGLAKLEWDKPPGLSGGSAGTGEDKAGAISHEAMGTLSYASPEQARGERVDARTDLYSFGATLHHMLTGRQPFEATTPELALEAILRKQPAAPSRLNPRLSADWDGIVLKAMEKDRELRYEHAAAIRADLGRLRHKQGRRTAFRRALVLGAPGVLAAVLAGYLLRTGGDAPLRDLAFTQVTDRAGQELYPSLSPDGASLAYAGRASGNWDVCLQRLGDKTPVNLTPDSPADDTQPAFSPDGKRIAFRSDRDGGGIFLMHATGESVRRLAQFGYQPSWSPDGKEIACATENYTRPESRFVLRSQIHLVDSTTGRTRALAPPGQDAIEPKWSPHGQRIAYWGVEGGRRDLWTIPAAGGAAVRVTNDAHLDWNPVWSPDGSHLYFSSNRGGSMNVWRVRIDERSGKTLRAPEPVTTPTSYSGQISFSQDGRQMAYVQLVRTSNLYQVGFDAQAGRVTGRPGPLTQGLREVARPDVTRDGRWLAFNTWGKEDIFVGRADGSGTRQLTDDFHKDRNPRWSPDGRRLTFISNRSGHYEIWSVHADGSGLRQLTHLFGVNVYGAAWAPDGARFATTINGGAVTYIVQADSPQRPEAIEALKEPPELFVANDWSRDGKKLAGFQMDRGDPDRQGVAVYRFDSGAVKRVAEFGSFPRWLSDSRRLVFSHRDRIYLADVESGKVRELASVSPDEIEWAVGVSGDDRRIYFTLISTEADIWLADSRPR